MKSSPEISQELKDISSLLAGMEKVNVFSVPEGYFNVLSLNILKNINTTSGTDRLSVPEGYFDTLSTSILNKIKSIKDNPSEELRMLSPMLYSIQNENVFKVPQGYFRDLPGEIINKVIGKPATKVVEMKKRISVWKYAAAAVLTGVVSVSSLMMLNTSRQSGGTTSIDPSVSTSIQTAAQFKSAQQIDAAIASLSDEEIIKYLDKTANDVDNEALATNINENELPAAKDYLLDESTLDTYLNQADKHSEN